MSRHARRTQPALTEFFLSDIVPHQFPHAQDACNSTVISILSKHSISVWTLGVHVQTAVIHYLDILLSAPLASPKHTQGACKHSAARNLDLSKRSISIFHARLSNTRLSNTCLTNTLKVHANILLWHVILILASAPLASPKHTQGARKHSAARKFDLSKRSLSFSQTYSRCTQTFCCKKVWY